MRAFGKHGAGKHYWIEGSPPLVIAEFGVSHMGDAEELMRAMLAYQCADIYKFQLHSPSEMVPLHRHKKLIHQCMLTDGELRQCFQLARDLGKLAACTAFSPDDAEALADWYDRGILDIIKVGSGEADNVVMRDIYTSRKRRIIVSRGMSDYNYWAEAAGDNVAFMHCVSEYPTQKHDLIKMSTMAREMPTVAIGYSDHSESSDSSAAVVASAMGAAFLERHVTVSKSSPDIKVEDNPLQFILYWENVRRAWRDLRGEKYSDRGEDTRGWALHYLVAKNHIRPGDSLSGNVTTARVDGNEYDVENYLSASSNPVIYQATEPIIKGSLILKGQVNDVRF